MFEEELGRRLQRLTWVVTAVIAVLALTLASMQLGPAAAKYASLADRNRLRLLTIPAPRGEIFDRKGVPLAGNRPTFGLSLMFLGWDEVRESAARLGELLGLDPGQIEERVKAQGYRLYQPVRIVEALTPEQQSVVEEHSYELPGVVVEVQPQRFYPNGTLAAHVLGYMREIGPQELEDKEGYRLGDLVGKSGLEAMLEPVLRGKDGGRQVEVNHRGFPVRDIPPATDPVPGKDVTLSLDADLQKAAEQALADTITRLQTGPGKKYPGAKAGAVVALDPATGEVLALVSYPAFDPNVFTSPVSAEDWSRLSGPERPLWNRAISGTYAPGSTFKMVTATAALMEGKVRASERVLCPGFHPITAAWSRPKRCWARGGHGAVDLRQAIAKSCDVYFYEMGRRLGVDGIARWARAYGFGSRTGIELAGESAGTVASTEYKAWAYAARAKDGSRLFPWIDTPRWQYPAEDMDASIGQGFQNVTPLQMAVYTAAIANGGIRYRPLLVKEIRDPAGAVEKFAPYEEGRISLPDEVWRAIREGMRAVTLPGGTAAGVFAGFPVEVAGKTGTAQNPHGDDHGWFVCYAPYQNPTIALAVLIEQGGHGTAAAGVARQILASYFRVDTNQVSQTAITTGE
ncbi:MAG TPA: penicillin-binding protein 2 [Firmicutes bacterium]|nr:penicillin-binding protein 2 [Bacillota bacterium]